MKNTMKAAVSLLALASLLLFTSGCATILKGEYRDVKLGSEPEGAEVYINGDFYGKTPLKLELKPNQSYTIEFKKEGYETQVRQIKNQIGVGWIVLDAICGVVPVLVDALTGAWFELDQKYVNALLEKQQDNPLL